MEQTSINQQSLFVRIFRLYFDGFRKMTLGRTLWKVIIIKLIIMFAVLKLFFFPNFLNTHFTTDTERADYVLEQITQPGQSKDILSRRKRYDREF